MKLKFLVALAAAIWLAGPGLSNEAAAFGRGGGFGGHGGFGHGGFGGHGFGGHGFGGHGFGHMHGFSRGYSRGLGARSFSHYNFRGRNAYSRGFGHYRNLGANRSHLSHRYGRYNRLSSGASRNALTHNLAGQHFTPHNLHNAALRNQLHNAIYNKQTPFWNKQFNSNWNRFQDHGWWRNRYGYWNGYRWWGPVFWPYFWGDYFSFAFWPGAYYDPFWGYGPDAILWGAFWPYGEFYYDNTYAYDGYYGGEIYAPYRRRIAKAQPDAAAKAATVAETCSGFAPGVSDLPIQKLEGIIDATADQRTALADLKTAVGKASEILNKSCPSESPLTPVARLDAMKQRLQAMEEANQVVRAPLGNLYSLLTDQQRQRLEAASQPSRRRRSAHAKDVDVTGLCSSQGGFTAVPADQIASTITLTSEQQQELDKLKAASAKASNGLKSSCPTSIPDTLDGRLDAAQQRVAALIQAVDTVRPAVNDFYAALTDEQKAALSVQPAGNPRG